MIILWCTCTCVSSVHTGQRISPTPVIEVPVNGTIIIMCESFIQGQSSSNSLQIYQPEVDTFSTFMSDRLVRSNENGGSNTNYTFGPLMEGDNGTIFRCSSSSRNSQNSTISVTCKYNNKIIYSRRHNSSDISIPYCSVNACLLQKMGTGGGACDKWSNRLL